MKRAVITGIMFALFTSIVPSVYGGLAMSFSIKSPDFEDNGYIPRKFSCDGDDISPELKWTNPPIGTKSYAMIVEDPDAPIGTFVHWIIYDIPAGWDGLKRAMKATDGMEQGVKQGRTDFGSIGWGGPCPPRGHGKHRYVFTIKALDTSELGLTNGTERISFNKAINGHVLEEAVLMGLYRR